MNSVVPVTSPGQNPTGAERSIDAHKIKGSDFRSVLQKAKQDHSSLKFSRHASERVESRGIQLTHQDLDRLEDAISRARDKGSRNTLILMDGRAFIVGARTGTVVTVAGEKDLASQVITNIDATVLA